MAQVGDKRPNPSTVEANPTVEGLGEQEKVTKRPRVENEPWSDMSFEDIPNPPVYLLPATCVMPDRKNEDIEWCPDETDHDMRLSKEDCGAFGRVLEYRPAPASVRLAAEKRAKKRAKSKHGALSSPRHPAQVNAKTDAKSCPGASTEAKDRDPLQAPSQARHQVDPNPQHEHTSVDEVYRALLSAIELTNRLVQPARAVVTDPTGGDTERPSKDARDPAKRGRPEGSPTVTAPTGGKSSLLMAATASLHHLSTACHGLISDFLDCAEQRNTQQARLDATSREVDELRKGSQRDAFMIEETTQIVLGLIEGLRFDLFSMGRVVCKLETESRRINYYLPTDEE